MKLQARRLLLLAAAIIAPFVVSGCQGRHRDEAAGGGAAVALTQLNCGDKTYRLDAARITADVNDGCARYRASQDALRGYRATRTRFICQQADGRVTQSILVPSDQLEQYNANRREYQAGQRLPKLVERSNALARQHLDRDNTLFHQSKSDLTALNKLVKAAGGSVEIPD